jgi:hypothetical protein
VEEVPVLVAVLMESATVLVVVPSMVSVLGEKVHE